MATKSILKNVDIKNQHLGKSLVIALENASNKQSKDVILSRRYKDIQKNDIKSVLGVKE